MNGIGQQLETLVRSAHRKVRGDFRFLGVHHDAPGELPAQIEVQGQAWSVRRARSPLEVRMALVEAGSEGRLLLVAPRSLDDPGLEVTARLAGKRFQEVEPWQLVRELFQARRLDRRVVTMGPWVAHELLAGAPPGGYSPAPSGLLDLETAWGGLFARLGLSGPRPSIADLLRASVASGPSGAWRAAGEDFRAAARQRLEETAGAAGGLAGGVLEQGAGNELLPIGLVLDCLRTDDPRALVVRTRLERFGLHLEDPAQAAPWADEAVRWVRAGWEAGGDEQAGARAVLDRAGELVEELRLGSLVEASDVLHAGLEARTSAFAEALATATAPAAFDREAAERAYEALAKHLFVDLDPGFADRKMRALEALRLARWLAIEEGAPSSLADHAARYRDEGAYVDRARHAIARGESQRELAVVYEALVERAAARREAENEAFAGRLAGVLAGQEGPGELLPIEQALPRVVAPLAERIRVLLVVMDGMSEAVAEELSEELQRAARLQRMSPNAYDRLPPMVGLLPSVTEVCRTSLLSGAPSVGHQAEEVDGFERLAAQHGWRGRVTQQPILFHQAALTGRNERLAGEVVKSIEGNMQVVAVVVNAVDAQLDGARQMRPRWTLAQVPVLEELVHCAEAKGRAVVLTADHGHVVDAGRTRKSASSGRDGRWRPTGEALETGEIELRGDRVLLPEPGGPCVVPWSEEIRYSNPHAGYHGGASPQEVVTPLIVLVPEAHCAELDGWSAEVRTRPRWWDASEEAAVPRAPVRRPDAARRTPVTKAAKRREGSTGSLFPVAEPAEVVRDVMERPEWVARLFTSDLWEAQRKLAGRTPPADADVAEVLAALEGGGGKLSLEALQNRTRFTAPRLRGLLAAMGRILNVDGYAVLEVLHGEGEVTLSTKLLFTQFAIEGA